MQVSVCPHVQCRQKYEWVNHSFYIIQYWVSSCNISLIYRLDTLEDAKFTGIKGFDCFFVYLYDIFSANLKTIAAVLILTLKVLITRAPVKECSAFWCTTSVCYCFPWVNYWGFNSFNEKQVHIHKNNSVTFSMQI